MQLPLFGFCQGDLSVFWNCSEAVAEIEPPDIFDWRLYDATGRRIQLVVAREPLRRFWPLKWILRDRVVLVEGSDIDQDSLDSHLRRYISFVHESKRGVSDEWVKRSSLKDLIDLVIRKSL